MPGGNTRHCTSSIEFSGGGDYPGEMGRGETGGENTSSDLDGQLDFGCGEMT